MKKLTRAKCSHPLRNVWYGMKARCNSPASTSFSYYGARGIAVCDRWNESFDAFVEDMGPRPAGYSLDRIDSNGDYTPENCRWASRKTQAHNRASQLGVTKTPCQPLTYDGVTKTIAEWAVERNILRQTLAKRIAAEWTVGEALGFEVRQAGVVRGDIITRRPYGDSAATKEFKAIAEKHGVSYVRLRQQLNNAVNRPTLAKAVEIAKKERASAKAWLDSNAKAWRLKEVAEAAGVSEAVARIRRDWGWSVEKTIAEAKATYGLKRVK